MVHVKLCKTNLPLPNPRGLLLALISSHPPILVPSTPFWFTARDFQNSHMQHVDWLAHRIWSKQIWTEPSTQMSNWSLVQAHLCSWNCKTRFPKPLRYRMRATKTHECKLQLEHQTRKDELLHIGGEFHQDCDLKLHQKPKPRIQVFGWTHGPITQTQLQVFKTLGFWTFWVFQNLGFPLAFSLRLQLLEVR
jgi:hypothetical protein